MTIIPYRPVKNLCHYVSFMLYVSGGILDSAIKCFMINVPPEILVHSLANFHSQKEYRHMNLHLCDAQMSDGKQYHNLFR